MKVKNFGKRIRKKERKKKKKTKKKFVPSEYIEPRSAVLQTGIHTATLGTLPLLISLPVTRCRGHEHAGVFSGKLCSGRSKNRVCGQEKPEGTSSAILNAYICAQWSAVVITDI